MKKTKFFRADNLIELEKKLNDWLDKFSRNLDIISIQYDINLKPIDHNYTAMIAFKVF